MTMPCACHVGALCKLCTPALWYAMDAAILWSVPHSSAERSAARVKSDPHETLSQQAHILHMLRPARIGDCRSSRAG